MGNNNKTRQRLIAHYKKYPEMQIQDLFKYLYQSSFGCDHMLTSADKVTEVICAEREEKRSLLSADELVEELDGGYSRVSLSCLEKGLNPETLGHIFCASAKKEPSGKETLEEKILVLRKLICDKVIDISLYEFEQAFDRWRESGYQSLSHSDIFRSCYNPSYRVIANEYVRLLPLLTKIDSLLQNGSVIIAIEGGSASGKTTLGALLCDIYDANIFHMDDFFLRLEQRTPERYSKIGENIDWERFSQEVLIPLSRGEEVNYRRFNCYTMMLEKAKKITPKRISIVEGVYSMHKELATYYDLSVFLDIDPDLQRKRITKRNTPDVAKRFYEEWIPLENIYFEFFGVKEQCDIRISCD